MFRFLMIISIFAMAGVALGADQPNEIEQEFRIVWGGPRARAYNGSISISAGAMKLVRNLSMQENAVGVVQQSGPQAVAVKQQSATNFGGCDVVLRTSNTSRLQIVLRDGSGESVFERIVNVLDLQDKNWIDVVDEAGCRIAIERPVSDRLRVEQRDLQTTIFPTNTTWSPHVSGFKTGLPEGKYYLMATWANTRSNPVSSVPIVINADGSFPEVALNIQLPAEEGALRLELSVVRSNFMSAISGVKPLLQRGIDVVAIDPSAAAKAVAQWKPLLAIDTAAAVKPEGLSWLTSFTGALANQALEVPDSLRLSGLDFSEQFNRLIPFTKAAANYGAVIKYGNIDIQPFQEADSTADNNAVSTSASAPEQRSTVIRPAGWLSLPLSGLEPNQPHRLRVQIPIDRPSSLNVSVRDASDDKDLMLGTQSSLEIKEEDCQPFLGGSVTHEILFWPRSESITLLLASASRKLPATVGKILVEQAELTSGKSTPVAASNRQVALYIDQPLLVECYGAPREKDSASGRYYETWKTWQAIAERLTLHTQLAGANTLVLSGLSGGNSLVPMDSIPLQHRLNKATFFSDCRSPQCHDFIELLLQHFDRAGLKLVLEVDFPTADQFQPALSTEPDVNQVDLLSGTKQMIVGGELAAPRRLNPLHAKVQNALVAPLQEIVQRYHSHSSFGGLSLRLDNNSQFLFAGDRWGYNDNLIQKFASENGLVISADQQQRLQLFTGPARLRFVKWRAQQLTRFVGQLVSTLRSINASSEIYLNLIRLADRSPSESDFLDSDGIARDSTQMLLGHGVDIDSLSKIRGLTITQGVVVNTNRLPSSNDLFRETSSETLGKQVLYPQAMLITHQPRALKLAAELDSSRRAANEMWIYPDAIRRGSRARRILLEQLWNSDPVMLGFGGWHPVWVGDGDVSSLLTTYQSLPLTQLSALDVLPNDSPVRIRTGVDQGRGFMSIVNLSPWEVSLTLKTSGRASTVELLATSSGSFETVADGLLIRVPAYQLMVFRSTNPPELHVQSASYQLPEHSVASTSQRLKHMDNLLAQAADPGQQKVLFGASGTFEQWTNAHKPVGWNVSTLPMTTIQRTNELPHSGSYSIMIENRGAEPVTAWIQSAPIDLPETGRLTLRAWLRAPAAEQAPPKVRLGVIGRTLTGERYQRSITYGGNQNDGARFLSNDWGRRPAELHLADIPVDNLVELQVAIDLIGQGRIWVDDVEVVQSWLHPDERNYLRGQILVAQQKMDNNNPFAAEQILRSPWSEFLFESGLYQTQTSPGGLMSPYNNETRIDWNRSRPTLQQLRESMLKRWKR